MTSHNVAIGIDLGTTNSAVAVVHRDRIEVIVNEEGSRIMPSVVAFTDTEMLVGEAASSQAVWNPHNTVYEVKRLIGRKFDDPVLQEDIKRWPFKVQNVDGSPKVEIEFMGEQKLFTPEEISAMILSKLKEIAETFVGHPVKDAVITVPAYFNDSQRQATIDAGIIAGLNVIKLINEPTAAAIAYGVDKEMEGKRNVLIYDLGGGTLDVVIMSIENGNFEVMAVNGNTHLGGGDFDGRLVDFFVEECTRKHGLDVAQDRRSLGKLRKACQRVKQGLSSSSIERIQIEALHQGVNFSSSITRTRFEHLCSDLFSGTIDCVEAVLADSGLDKEDIDEIVLAGGSTRIRNVQELLKDFFPGKKLNRTLNPDEAVAYGAAVQAAKLSQENFMKELRLTDVTPFSLGVRVVSDRMDVIIPRNTKIPIKVVRKKYTTASYDFQDAINFGVYEGEEDKAFLNRHLGKFVAEGIEIARLGVPVVDVIFEIDGNGVLHASAVDAKTGSISTVTITCDKGRLKAEDISRMVVQVEKFNACSSRQKEIDRARNDLEKFIRETKSSAEKKKSSGILEPGKVRKICEACEEALNYLEENESASTEELAVRKKELEKRVVSITSHRIGALIGH